jgi:hypothetical protein
VGCLLLLYLTVPKQETEISFFFYQFLLLFLSLPLRCHFVCL